MTGIEQELIEANLRRISLISGGENIALQRMEEAKSKASDIVASANEEARLIKLNATCDAETVRNKLIAEQEMIRKENIRLGLRANYLGLLIEKLEDELEEIEKRVKEARHNA